MTGPSENKDDKKPPRQNLFKTAAPVKASSKKDKDLGNLNKNFSTLSYLSTHDLQEPLRKIQTFSSRIMEKEEQNLSSEGKEYLARMNKAANRMQRLIDDLAIYSQVCTHERDFKLSEPEKLIKEAIADLQMVIIEKKAQIHANCPGEIRLIPEQFKCMIYNLLNNCLKFADAARQLSVNIAGSVVRSADVPDLGLKPRKKYYHIAVTDNGIGFEARFGEKIFEAFQRLNALDEYDGTGMGLAICRRIVENHHGKIAASGVPGIGCRIDIYLPV